MSKIFLCMCALTIAGVVVGDSAIAQNSPTGRGSKIVSGGFTFSSSGGDLYYEWGGDRLTVIQFSPYFAYFVVPGLALGGRFLLESTSQGESSLTTWGIGPHIMYFIGGNRPKAKAKGTTYPYLGSAFFYNRSTYKSGYWDSTMSGIMISFGGGVLHMLSNAVGLSGEASYQIDNMTPEGGASASGNTFNIGAGFTVFLY